MGHLRAVDRHFWDWPNLVTMPLFERPQSEPIAWLAAGWIVPSSGTARRFEQSGLVETEYEVSSFIVFEHKADGWVRLRFSRGAAGVAWTHACFFAQRSVRLGVERWEDRFLSGEISRLYFRAAVPHALRRNPAADAERVRWIPADPDAYAMRPREVRGDWMRVELSQPSDFCAGRDQPPVAKVEGWVQWRDESSGPWVWYYTRGC